MAILRGMDGKFYDVPDDQAAGFEVPRDKVKDLLEKSGGPPPQGGQGRGHGQGGRQGGPPSQGGPVVIQIFPGGGSGSPGGQGGPPGGGQPQGEGGEVDPYWWWANWPNWGNFWPNWGNY